VNIENDRGKAKAYPVRQVLLAIDKLKGGSKGGNDESPKDESQE
jgi:hypothetical protein